jgi:ABC-type multidrug transport system permease subunit|uniref:Uncharacterized protein n=1 Tax=Sipha flava TaxID=143950 RepID=A0A2S2Q946_9HEMI
MDINYRGFSSPFVAPLLRSRPVTVNRYRRTDLEDLLSVLMYEPNLSNRKAVYFNPHKEKKKKRTQPYAKYFMYATTSGSFPFYFLFYFIFSFLFFSLIFFSGYVKR